MGSNVCRFSDKAVEPPDSDRTCELRHTEQSILVYCYRHAGYPTLDRSEHKPGLRSLGPSSKLHSDQWLVQFQRPGAGEVFEPFLSHSVALRWKRVTFC